MFDRNRWLVAEQDDECIAYLARELGTTPLCARLLYNRGYTDTNAAKAFIAKSDSFLYDPYLLKDIRPAVARIRQAIENEEKITIYGDYDVDGVTSVSILYMYLKEHNADVDYYIPTRESEGYGLNESAFRMIKSKGTSLVITVDTGITAIEEIRFAKEIGLDIVVTDHHHCRPELPECHAVVNPRRPDCEYPFKELSGVGVIFKVICALELDFVNYGEYNIFTIKDMCRRYIDLVTIGTIADVMPLYDENRIMVYMGLGMLSSTRNIGVRALFRAVGIDPTKKINSSMIGYTVAPRINAAGRIGDASRAVQLFLASSSQVADIIADELCATNRERQQTENLIFTEAMAQIEREHDPEKESVLVLSSDHWHQGVIGIVASKITEQFGKPSILISFDLENGSVGKGSARSIKGLNMVEALAHCESLLVKYGGHELAAGLSVERDKLKDFCNALNAYAAIKLASPDCVPKTQAEAEITEDDISMETIAEIAKLEPYGAKNPEPLFVLRDVTITELVPLSQGKHSRLILRKNDLDISAICFGYNLQNEGFVLHDRVDVLCTININEFRGTQTIQLIVRDIDFSEWSWKELEMIEEEFQSMCAGTLSCDREDIPSRAEFASVYKLLLDLGYTRGKQISIMKFLAPIPHISYLKARIALEVFAEAELIELNKINFSTYYIKRMDAKEKKDLTATHLMKTLLGRNERSSGKE